MNTIEKARLTITVLVLLAAFAALGGEDGTLSLSPAVVMLRGDFGQSTSQTLSLTNGTSRPFSFDLIAQDVIVRDGKRTFVEAGSLPGSIAATAVFSQKHVEIAAGETVSVTVTATLPPSTQQRAVVAMFRGTNKVMSGKVPMMASLGSLLTFSISEDVAMSTEPLSVRAQSATESLGVTQSCTNSGREPLVARGVMAIVDSSGALIGKSAFKPHRLLPGESARLGGEYGGELDPGKYRVFVTYEFEGRSASASTEVDIR
jgi:hypothetical protein